MDYEYYVNRRPPSPPPLTSKLRGPYTPSPSLSSTSLHPLFTDTVFDIQSHLQPSPTPTPKHHRLSAPQPNFSSNDPPSSFSPREDHANTQSNAQANAHAHANALPYPSPKMPTLLNRRAVCNEYITLASTVSAADETETLRDRQEVVRIRLEHMLTEADARSTRVLVLALQKSNLKLDSLAAATRHIDEARTRMRVIESKYFHGTKASDMVAPELRSLHIRRGALATMVEHIQCTLHDQVRIHYLLSELLHKLASLRSLLQMLDRSDKPSALTAKRSDRLDDVPTVTSAPKQQASYHRQLSTSQSHQYRQGHGRDPSCQSVSHPRASFSGELARRGGFNRRVSRSYAFRQHSQDTALSQSPKRNSAGSKTLRTHRSLSRGSDNGMIPLSMKRAISYNSVGNTTTVADGNVSMNGGDEGSVWDEESDAPIEGNLIAVEAPSSVTSSPGRKTRGHGRLSFGNVQARFRGDRERSEDSGKLVPSSFGRRGGEGRPWRRRNGRLLEDGDSVDEESLHVSPVSYSTGSEQSIVNHNGPMNWSGRLAGEPSILLDIDSLCTEASTLLSSSRGMDGDKARRRGSLSSGLRHEILAGAGIEEGAAAKGLPKFGFGRIRVHGQMKKLWAEVNELYSIVLTHGPHLVEEKIVPRSSVETGLLGSWNAGKGQGLSLRVNVQSGIVVEAMRKADGIVNWQHRLVVAIRRDFYEQRKALSEADRVISQAYLSSLDMDDDKLQKC